MANTIKVIGTVEIQGESPVKILRDAAKFVSQCNSDRLQINAVCLGSGYPLEGADDQETIFVRVLRIDSFTRRPGVFMAFVDGNLIAVRCTGNVLVSIYGER
jgi:hypothetical protein